MSELNITLDGGTSKRLLTAGKFCDKDILVTANASAPEGIPEEAFVITGDCTYRFTNGGWNWFIEEFGGQITTKDITNADHMFHFCNLSNIPFELNFKNPTSFEYIFYYCQNMETFPKLIHNYKLNSHLKFGNMFANCSRMKTIPEGLVELMRMDYELSSTNTTFSPWNNMFAYCYSLREIPNDVIKYLHNPTQTGYYYGLAYSKPFNGCACLEKLENIIPDICSLTSNQWNNWFNGLYRLKEFTFATNEDGTPLVRPWKSQTLDFTYSGRSVGVCSGATNILNFSSGITADKEVIDDASYQALKDDPDWFTQKAEYSRYNHDSAVNTINSLPDTSAYGTNTIKFMGNAGSATDGGAINTLTEEQIAIAAAKGWTVSLV